MEETNQEIGGDRLPIPASAAATEAASLDFIRTETVLSRLPVHNLAKQGRVNIQILKTTPTGELELKWEVSHSDRYGQARQLAYKLDTLIINQRIDEAGRPLPKLLRIGSLNDICAELNLATHAGQNSKGLRRAFLQNASLFITAKFDYRANDGTERHVEAGVTRYGVIFTGEKLPDGRKADAVYITFNDPFWDVLNSAPVRPLDRSYMKQLPPAAQRFYEIVSRKIFAALKNDYSRAKITYSEYCTYSAQLRHFERQRVQDQMAKVIRHHKKFGYITAIKYEPTIDGQNQADWTMYLTPGPRALAEFAAAHPKRRSPKMIIVDSIEKKDHDQQRRQSPSRELQPKLDAQAEPRTFDPQLVAEFTRRGITEKKAHELLANLKPGQDVVAQLEHTDYMIQNARYRIINPPGLYINLIASNTSIPQGFETNAKRKAREESELKEREHRAAEDARQLLESEYDDYCSETTDRYIEENPATFEAVKDEKREETRARYSKFPADMIESMAAHEARSALQKQAALPTFEEFLERKRQSIDFPMKPVAVLADAPAAFVAPPQPEIVMTDDAVVSPDRWETPADRGEDLRPVPEPPTETPMPETGIEPLPEWRQPEPDGNAVDSDLV
jgi:hypothetical protein